MAPRGTPGRLRILVVDDDADTVESMALWLRLEGYDVRTARGGPEALALAPGYRPDVVLLDMMMPGLDGREVARRLRHDPALPAPRIVGVTGLCREADRRRCLEAGCDEFWAKPVDPEQLRAFLESLRGGRGDERR
jgi:CheY-like chemotaxis protein